MIWIVLIVLAYILIISPKIRIFLFTVPDNIRYGIKDIISYFRDKRYNNARVGYLNCYAGMFGKGKTLSMVHDAVSFYKRYNNTIIKKDGREIEQQVTLLSNVEIKDYPYIYMKGLQQVVDLANSFHDYDQQHDTKHIIYIILDEASSQLNSRNFKNNISITFMATLLQSRKCSMIFNYSSQRFFMTDKLLRDVTTYVIQCNKTWRLQGLNYYDACDLENCLNPNLVKPIMRRAFFVRDCDYNAYDTIATVDQLERDTVSGQMLSDEEILNLRTGNPEIESVSRLKRKKKK